MSVQRLFGSRTALACFVALALASASCQRPVTSAAVPANERAMPAPPRASASALPPSVESGTHVRWLVGTTGDYAPFSLRDGDADPRGFDIDVGRALAHDLGAEIVWVSTTWPKLQASLEAGEFQVVMSGVTWQPARSVVGYMTRAVGRGGPCVLGDARATPVAVNRGGVLEKWARGRWPESALVVVDDNRSLPALLANGSVRAIVTDSFELHAFARPEWHVECEPRVARKVYWVAPGLERSLGRDIDAWLATHADTVQAAQQRWFRERQSLRPLDHLADLLARRLAFMPLVAAAKAKAGLSVEDASREKVVLDAVAERAHVLGLPPEHARSFFALQIELAKAVQRRQQEATTLELGRQIRPALNELGDRILDALLETERAGELAHATLADLEPLTPFLEATELARVVDELHAFAGVPAGPVSH